MRRPRNPCRRRRRFTAAASTQATSCQQEGRAVPAANAATVSSTGWRRGSAGGATIPCGECGAAERGGCVSAGATAPGRGGARRDAEWPSGGAAGATDLGGG
eukprot:108517-Chlamydomonas_euryale.AAC.1